MKNKLVIIVMLIGLNSCYEDKKGAIYEPPKKELKEDLDDGEETVEEAVESTFDGEPDYHSGGPSPDEMAEPRMEFDFKGVHAKITEIRDDKLEYAVWVLLDSEVNKDRYGIIEELALAMREEHNMFEGRGSRGKVNFLFYSSKKELDSKSINHVLVEYENKTKTMSILWGLSGEKTVIKYDPFREVVRYE